MQIALFATCLVDLMRPQVGFAAVRLLEAAGCEVHVPLSQTCCGQPAYNSGDVETARALARNLIETFEGYEHVVVPSGSCAGMMTVHLPALFAEEPHWRTRAEALARRCHELTGFLSDVLQVETLEAAPAVKATITYHDSCASLREMHVARQPRALLGRMPGVELRELATPEVCCGFGGTFCVKYPEISEHMVQDKVEDIEATGADMVVAADLGCLLNIAGRLRRNGSPVRAFHVAELLAGMTEGPAIGEGDGS